jgi:hypothetical protein
MMRMSSLLMSALLFVLFTSLLFVRNKAVEIHPTSACLYCPERKRTARKGDNEVSRGGEMATKEFEVMRITRQGMTRCFARQRDFSRFDQMTSY